MYVSVSKDLLPNMPYILPVIFIIATSGSSESLERANPMPRHDCTEESPHAVALLLTSLSYCYSFPSRPLRYRMRCSRSVVQAAINDFSPYIRLSSSLQRPYGLLRPDLTGLGD